nr:MAG TPA: hemolysin XhlA [Caudoviricetes sp.]DAY17326.1 MAG TPA: hemolysin [Caudoviricetes sp.]
MSQDTYSKSEIDLKLDKINSDTQHGFEKIDLKIDQLKQEMRSGFEKVDLKFDNFEKRVETMLLTQENKRLEEQAKSKKEFMYWFIGLLVSTLLGILAIIVTILTTK